MHHCSIDATVDTGRLGRLINHADTKILINSRMKCVVHRGCPVLCLFATRRIMPNEQILYDYGVNVPWNTKVCALIFELGNFYYTFGA